LAASFFCLAISFFAVHQIRGHKCHYCMKLVCLSLLILSSLIIQGQSIGRWQYAISMNPEVTFYNSRYTYSLDNHFTTGENIGLAGGLEYQLNKRIYLNTGVGFIMRKLHTRLHMDQSALPPPHQSFTQELVTTKSITYRTLNLPLHIGCKFLEDGRFAASLETGVSANYLISGYYEVSSAKYQGGYKKRKWQGSSIDIGLSNDYQLSEKIKLNTAVLYTITNTVATDEFISARDQRGYSIGYLALALRIGIKAAFQ
jgi:hypothetical protein